MSAARRRRRRHRRHHHRLAHRAARGRGNTHAPAAPSIGGKLTPRTTDRPASVFAARRSHLHPRHLLLLHRCPRYHHPLLLLRILQILRRRRRPSRQPLRTRSRCEPGAAPTRCPGASSATAVTCSRVGPTARGTATRTACTRTASTSLLSRPAPSRCKTCGATAGMTPRGRALGRRTSRSGGGTPVATPLWSRSLRRRRRRRRRHRRRHRHRLRHCHRRPRHCRRRHNHPRRPNRHQRCRQVSRRRSRAF